MRVKTTQTLLPCHARYRSRVPACKDRKASAFGRLSFTLLFSFLLALFTAPSANAQCTSKDVKIQRAFLAKEDGSPITQCSDVPYLWVEMFTKAPRVGALVQATIEIRNDDNSVVSSQPVSFCYMGALSTGTTFRFAQVPWVCGKLVVLKNVYIAWGTGQDPFCTSTDATPSPGTSSKCNQQVQGDQVIVVEIPDINPAFTFTPGSCSGNNRTISFTATATGGTGDFTYSWDFGDGNTDGPNTSNTTSHAFAGDASYLVKLTVTDADPTVTPQVYTRTINVASCCNPPSITGEFINGVSGLTTSATYGNVSKILSVTATGDGLHYQWQSYDGTNWNNVGTDANAYTITATDAGTYQYRVIVTGDCGTVIDGTAATSNTFTLTINPANLTITATDKHKTYGTTLTSPVSGSTPTDFTVSGLQNSETVGSVTINYGTGSAANAAVGTYSSQVTPSAATGGTFNADNYNISYVKGAIIVDAVNLTITATDKHKTYGTTLTSPVSGSTPTDFTVSGLQNSETVGSVTINYGTGSAANAAVGTYSSQVTPSAATGGTFNADNYNISYVKGAIIVDAVNLTITATDKHKTYGTTLTSPVSGSTPTDFTVSGLQNSETVGSVTINYGTGSAANAAVGTYSSQVTPSAATGGTFNADNYNISYVKGAIIVDAVNLTITATDKHKTYGTTLTSPVSGSTPTDFTVSGLQNSETVGSVTINYGTGSAANAAVGTYSNQVTPSAATGGTFNADNYNISYVKGAIIVDAVNLTITATDKHKTYGTTLTSPVSGSTPTDFTVSGLQNSETVGSVTINYGTGSAANAAVGTYSNQVTPSAATGGTFNAGNYNISYVKGAIIVDAVQICPDYTGLLFANTNSSGVYTDNNGKIRLTVFLATPPSSGTITASDPVVTFYNNTNGHQLIGVGTYTAPTLANPYPSWSVDWTVPNPATSTTNSTTYTIAWEVTGNFSNANCDDNNTLITFAPPASDFTTGGGFIWNKNSVGRLGQNNTNGSAFSTKNNFGFNVKWNKNLSNLQGDFNTIIRMGGNNYQVKSNKPGYLNIVKGTPYTTSAGKTITPYTAYVVYSNVVIKALTPAGCALVPNCSVGNGTVSLTVVDNGEPGSSSSPKPDQIGFTVRDQYNTIYYATNSNINPNGSLKFYVNDASLNNLDAGNIQVHVNGAVAPAQTTRDAQSLSATALAQNFVLAAIPNPTHSYFTLQLPNQNRGTINLRVMDALGRVVELKQNVAAGQNLRLGSSYKPGVYVVEVQQGDTVKQLKLIKE